MCTIRFLRRFLNMRIDPKQNTLLGKGNILSIQSHVAFGHAGNSSAVFPMQRMGYNVIDVNTVLFSNHTGYGEWGGDFVSLDTVKSVLQGVQQRGAYTHTKAVVTGYMGSPVLGDTIMQTIATVKSQSAKCVYVCDPVFGDVGRGIFAINGIAQYFRDVAVKQANICTPNLFELGWLTDTDPKTIDDIIVSARMLLNTHTHTVVVTSADHTDTSVGTIEMLAITASDCYRVITPKVNMVLPPNGSGDATTALFTTHYLDTDADLQLSLARTASSIYEIFKATAACESFELQIIRAGDKIAYPDHIFKACKV